MFGLDTLVAQAFDRDDLHDARHSLVNSIVMTLVLTPALMSVVSVMPALMLRVGVKSETVATMGAVPARTELEHAPAAAVFHSPPISAGPKSAWVL